MGLNFSVKDIEDKDFCYRKGRADLMEREGEDYFSYEIDSIVMWSYVLGYGHIKSEADAHKWYERYARWMLALGDSDDSKWYVKPEHVLKSIGLTTNVGMMTDAAFAKKVRERIEESARVRSRDLFKALNEPTPEV